MIGVFGGTFDPVHYGHLEPARDVMRQLALEKVLFIPNRFPPHREQPGLSAAQRVELLELALVDYPGFEIDLRELRRIGPSYMVDTLESLVRDYPGKVLCLIIGMDAFLGIESWHRWRQLFDHCHIIVTARPGFALPGSLAPSLAARLVDDTDRLARYDSGGILIKSCALLDISSTDVRRAVESGDDANELMPRAVYDKYREMTGLYADR